jgi:hypothetical protein
MGDAAQLTHTELGGHAARSHVVEVNAGHDARQAHRLQTMANDRCRRLGGDPTAPSAVSDVVAHLDLLGEAGGLEHHVRDDLAARPLYDRPPPEPRRKLLYPLEDGLKVRVMTRSHGVSGTITDDRTLTLTNFDYDGRGRDVRVLLAKDGDYRNGVLVGPQLLRPDEPYLNETLSITLPEGVSLSDFNSVSIWCVAVGASWANDV